MDLVRELVEGDPQVKGIWCVPKYANPTGVTYSDEVVRAFAALRPAAPDFRIFWDNAYAVHTFEGEGDELLNIFDALAEAGADNLVYEFASTAKVTFPSSGMAWVTASPADMAELRGAFSAMRVSPGEDLPARARALPQGRRRRGRAHEEARRARGSALRARGGGSSRQASASSGAPPGRTPRAATSSPSRGRRARPRRSSRSPRSSASRSRPQAPPGPTAATRATPTSASRRPTPRSRSSARRSTSLSSRSSSWPPASPGPSAPSARLRQGPRAPLGSAGIGYFSR